MFFKFGLLFRIIIESLNVWKMQKPLKLLKMPIFCLSMYLYEFFCLSCGYINTEKVRVPKWLEFLYGSQLNKNKQCNKRVDKK